MTSHGDDAHKYKNIIDFASNLNPHGTSKKALKAVKNNLNKISQYPDSECKKLRKALAEYNNVTPENIIAGNGSAEIIRLFCEVFLNNGDVVLIPIPTFLEYEANARLFGGKIKNIELNSNNNFKINIDEILDKIDEINDKLKIIFLCSPNNPTGKSISKKDVLKIVRENPKTYVFLDEAFIEFSDQQSLAEYVEKYKNLFILRSMTKFFALAGLRIGYGIGSKNLINKLSFAKLEWNVNVLAQIAAIESLKDKEYIRNSKLLIKKEKENLFKELYLIPELKVYPSDANFFLINIQKTEMKSNEAKERILKKGILLRDCSNFIGLDENYIRICVRTVDENEKLLNTIKEVIVLGKDKLIGANRECKYYPCHDLDIMDCTFCFCPFYPCEDTLTGGETVMTESGEVVWGCKNCNWIHKPDAARKILNEILKLKLKDNVIDRKKLLKIRLKCLK